MAGEGDAGVTIEGPTRAKLVPLVIGDEEEATRLEKRRKKARRSPKYCVGCEGRGKTRRLPWWTNNDCCEDCLVRTKDGEAPPSRKRERGTENVYLPNLGDVVKRSINPRTGRRYLQQEVGEAVGVGGHAVQKWANGTNRCPLPTAKKIAEVLGVSLEDLGVVEEGD
jgi:DNA-binding XRE family transcriptional regulator